MADLMIIAVLLLAVACVLRRSVRIKRQGGCTGGCAGCNMECSHRTSTQD